MRNVKTAGGACFHSAFSIRHSAFNAMPHTPDTHREQIDPALTSHASARDVQRAALRELVSLLTESATTESEIETRHRAAQEELNKATERVRQDIEHRQASSREEADRKHEEWVAQVDAKFQEGIEALDAS